MWCHLVNWQFPCSSALISQSKKIQKTNVQIPWLFQWEATLPWLNLAPFLCPPPHNEKMSLFGKKRKFDCVTSKAISNSQSCSFLFSYQCLTFWWAFIKQNKTKQTKSNKQKTKKGRRKIRKYPMLKVYKNSNNSKSLTEHNYSYKTGLFAFPLFLLSHLGGAVYLQISPLPLQAW